MAVQNPDSLIEEIERLRDENGRLKSDLNWERANYIRYRKALDAIYLENDVARAAVVKHFGTCHTPPVLREASYYEESERASNKLRTALVEAKKSFEDITWHEGLPGGSAVGEIAYKAIDKLNAILGEGEK